MIDDHDVLERALRRFRPEPGMVDRVLSRRDRKRRNQRIGGGVLGAVIAIAMAAWGALVMLGADVAVDEPRPTPSAVAVDGTVTYTGSGCRLDVPGTIEGDRFVLSLINDDSTREAVFWIRMMYPSEQRADLDPRILELDPDRYVASWPVERLDPASTGVWAGPPPHRWNSGRWVVQCFEDRAPGPSATDLRFRGAVGPIEVG